MQRFRMKTKFLMLMIAFVVISGLLYAINRVSTLGHPWGNWVLAFILAVIAVGFGSWLWQREEDE